jgi:hypothetical protein
MPLSVEAAFLGKKPTLKIGVAVDGSVMSDKALAWACSWYDKKKGDQLVILHVSDPSKTWLTRHLQPDHLKNSYVSKAYDFRVRYEALSFDG